MSSLFFTFLDSSQGCSCRRRRLPRNIPCSVQHAFADRYHHAQLIIRIDLLRYLYLLRTARKLEGVLYHINFNSPSSDPCFLANCTQTAIVINQEEAKFEFQPGDAVGCEMRCTCRQRYAPGHWRTATLSSQRGPSKTIIL